MFWIGLLVGMPIGAVVGVFTIAICSAERRHNNE